MNEDANTQQAQTPQSNPQDDAAVESKYVSEAAQRILADEQAQPGSQDPDAVAWAQSAMTSAAAAAAPGPTPEVPGTTIAPQDSGPSPTEQAASADGHVLIIDRSEPPAPQDSDGGQPKNDNQGQPQ
jgi:hypothetical protein